MIEDRIISVLIGLVRACNNNPKTAATDSLVVKALAFPLLCPNCGDKAVNEIIDEIHTEKNSVAPGCAVCTAPCGNTSDYDMRRIYEADELFTIKLLKIQTVDNAFTTYFQHRTSCKNPQYRH